MHYALLGSSSGENPSRERRTEGISLITQTVFTFGVALWAVYGMLLNNRPIFFANVVTLVFSLAILILKLWYP